MSHKHELTDAGTALLDSVRKAVETEIARIVEKETESLLEKVRQQVRAQVGAISGSIFSHYSMHRNGSDILITVKFDDKTKGT